MVRAGVTVGLAVLIAAGNLYAAESAEVQALKQQITQLRKERDANTKALHAQYDAIINQTKMSEAQLHEARKNLATQESQLNALDSSAASKQVQGNMEALRNAMKEGVKLDAAQINALRAQRKAHVDAVAAAYNAKIKQLEAAIKSAPKASAAKPATTKK
jgi:hypothetical protein